MQLRTYNLGQNWEQKGHYITLVLHYIPLFFEGKANKWLFRFFQGIQFEDKIPFMVQQIGNLIFY